MQELIIELLTNFWELLASIAGYILIGVILAAVFKHFLPETLIKRHLGIHNFSANIKAAMIGIPLPLCSCSVIPFISALKKSGASKSAIQTFLISTPITGADSILATYGVLGWLFTAYRTIASVLISLFAGFLSLLFVKEDTVDNSTIIQSFNIKAETIQYAQYEPAIVSSDCSSCANAVTMESTVITEASESISCCSASLIETSPCGSLENSQQNRVKQDQLAADIVKNIFIYAFDDIFKDIAKSLLIGIALGALIMTFMPENLTTNLSNSLLLNYVLVIMIAMPLYVCATSSVPMGVALLAGGFTPGAVFIFLTAGPATNAITMSVVSQTLGNKSLFVYLFSILVGSLFFAIVLDIYFADVLNNIMAITHEHETLGFIKQVSAVIMLYLSFKYIFKKNATIASSGCGCG